MLETMPAVITKRLLIIDPQPNMRQVVQTCLKTIGRWEVLTAASGQEGLAQAEANQPDAILLESIMLAMPIISFLQQLRSNPKTSSIPIIFLTEELSLTERHRFLALGAVGAIAKPFDPLTLVPQIAALLGWQLDNSK
jgi:CheY-like chemotaxis protein